MDAKFILDSALVCDNNSNECDFKDLCYVDNATRNSIITIHDYYEQKLKAERAKVMQEVREHIIPKELEYGAELGECYDAGVSAYLDALRFVLNKLDSMEPGKEATNGR